MAKKGGGSNGWEGLPLDVLSQIFVRLPWQENVKVVPFVCRSWRLAASDPSIWRDIEIQEWCRLCNDSTRIDMVVTKLIRKSHGTFRKLCAYKLGNDRTFYNVANSAKHLEVLKIPVSGVSDKMVELFATELGRNLKVLDVSYCGSITHRSLEALGRHCNSLVHLRRNMPPSLLGESESERPDEGEAMAVANYMPGLIHLELCYGRFSDRGLEAILTHCRGLIHLDIQGCWNVELDDDLEDRCEQIEDFKGPRDYDLLEEEQQLQADGDRDTDAAASADGGGDYDFAYDSDSASSDYSDSSLQYFR